MEAILIEQPMPEELEFARCLLKKILNGNVALTELDRQNLSKIQKKLNDEKKKLVDH